MTYLKDIIDLFLHVDKHLQAIIASAGNWTYAILFMIIFLETGFVVTPFLPGDSLLFAAGAFAATGSFNVVALVLLLWAAAVLGDNVNYWIGRTVGPKLFAGTSNRFFNRKHLDKTQAFYDKHGGKTLVMARFMPIVRTFAPFVAGIGKMSYPRFLAFSVGGGALWISLFTFAGFFFGNMPAVKSNFKLVIVAVILLSVLPMVYEALKHRREVAAEAKAATQDLAS
jgi:membrane-associated protein